MEKKKPKVSLNDGVDLVKSEIKENNLSVRAACQSVATAHQFNAESLRKTYQRSLTVKTKTHGNQILSDVVEKKLVSLILAFSSSGIALPQHMFLSFVREVIVKQQNWTGNAWFRGFVSRHKNFISYAKKKGLDMQRINNVSQDVVKGFLKSYEQLHNEHNIDSDFLINADESPCEISKSLKNKVLISRKSATQGVMHLPKSTLRTILPFVAASGRVWMVVLIYKLTADSEDKTSSEVSVPSVLKQMRGTWPTYYAATAKGFITNDLWRSIIGAFTERLKVSLGGKHALLLLDRHSVHLEIASLNTLLESNIHPLYLPAHTTHIIQPLDNVILGGLKQRIQQKKNWELIRRLIEGEDLSTILQDVFTDIDSTVFERNTVIAGFRNTGIYPFNKQLILENFANEFMWHQKSNNKTSAEIDIAEMVDQFKAKLFPNNNTVKRKARISEKNKAHTGEAIVKIHIREQHEKEEKEQQKEEKIQQREEKKRQKEEEKRQREEERRKRVNDKAKLIKLKMDLRENMTCSNCSSVSRSEANIYRCSGCNIFKLCLRCQKNMNIREDHECERNLETA